MKTTRRIRDSHIADLLETARENNDLYHASDCVLPATLEAVTIVGRRVLRAVAAPVAAALVLLTCLVANAAERASVSGRGCTFENGPNGTTIITCPKK
jgi:hypothetical protein